jgi:hypothetical protein
VKITKIVVVPICSNILFEKSLKITGKIKKKSNLVNFIAIELRKKLQKSQTRIGQLHILLFLKTTIRAGFTYGNLGNCQRPPT